MSTYEQDKVQILRASGASFWLKKAIQDMEKRDPVDAWADAKTLMNLQEKRLKEMGV